MSDGLTSFLVEKAEGPRNLRVVAITAFLAGLFSSMTHAVWQPFVLSLGAPMSTLGLLESLGGWRGVVPALIQPIGGWLSDRLRRKPLLALSGLVGLLGRYKTCPYRSGSHHWRLAMAAAGGHPPTVSRNISGERQSGDWPPSGD